MSFEFLNLGLIDYQQALQQQEQFVEEVFQNNLPGKIIFCTHPPVVTLGRGTQAGDVYSWQGPTIEISRGGRATYHGPSQLVVYPVINLNMAQNHRPAKDIGIFLRNFEQSIVNLLKIYGVESQGRSIQQKNGEAPPIEETGVWVGRQKIASLGIAVRKWVTYHGAAINLYNDPQAFQGMLPCGFQPNVMTNLESQIGKKIPFADVSENLKKELSSLL
jgi:lipoyl(octanoyl) transferase